MVLLPSEYYLFGSALDQGSGLDIIIREGKSCSKNELVKLGELQEASVSRNKEAWGRVGCGQFIETCAKMWGELIGIQSSNRGIPS